MIKGRIIIHAVGGAGINCINENKEELYDLAKAGADIVITNVDSSENNISKFDMDEKKESFYLMKDKNFDDKLISGSGGDKRTNAPVLLDAVPDYLNSLKQKTAEVNELHIVVFSGSGGTASLTGPKIALELLKKGIPVIPMVITDSSTSSYANSSLTTLKSLGIMSTKAKKKLTYMLYVNDKAKGTQHEKGQAINEDLIKNIKYISIMFRGDAKDIDFQDMQMLFNINNFKSAHVKLPDGLYRLACSNNDNVDALAKLSPILNRSMSICGNLDRFHHHKLDNLIQDKNGMVSDDVKLEGFIKSGIHTLHLTIIKFDEIGATIDELEKSVKVFDASMKSIPKNAFEGNDDDTDDDGLLY